MAEDGFPCLVCGGKFKHYANCYMAWPDDEVYSLSSITLRPRVLVTGGRNFANRYHVWWWLDRLTPSAVAEGGATGADAWAKFWCWNVGLERSLDVEHHQYKILPGESPFARNERMLQEFKPDVVLAFMGANGTNDMITRSVNAGVYVKRTWERD